MGIAPAHAQTASEVVLHSFGAPPKGGNPWAGVIRDSAGNLYGTASTGGAANQGVVYRLDTSGNVTVLYSFTGGADGRGPLAGVIPDSAGNLYGTTGNGGDLSGCFGYGCGVVFKLDPSGQETVLYSFTGGADGSYPDGGVILDPAGNLYGTTVNGGIFFGVVYKLDPAGQETVLYSFMGEDDGANPYGGVIRDSAGNLYGTARNLGVASCGVVYMLDTAGQQTVLHGFTGGSDGCSPNSGVIRGSADNLYGTTFEGGTANSGVVYTLDTAGQETVLHSFTGGAADGSYPFAGVIRSSTGNLYGTTPAGGATNSGVVYKLDTAGQETVLYSFTGGADWDYPDAGVIADSSGNLYGTTDNGGSGGSGGSLLGTSIPAGYGVVYKLDAAGQETMLYSFPGAASGSNAYAGLIRDSAGNFYGTTSQGGTVNAGVVFELDTAGQETVLYSFTGGSDGGNPYASVVRDSSGNLYGTTYSGGVSGQGVVFKLDTTGTETVLHSFTGGADGGNPYAGVIRDPAGNLYGTTYSGGASGQGVVFKLDTTGTETVLHSFTGGADGATRSQV
jgi:uncharacterized repeat protein (TIGR03803 family)